MSSPCPLEAMGQQECLAHPLGPEPLPGVAPGDMGLAVQCGGPGSQIGRARSLGQCLPMNFMAASFRVVWGLPR